jgi:D-alanine--D-alanine ligase
MDKQELKGKTLLVLNTGSIKKKFIIQKLKKLGLTLIVLHKEQNWADPYVDHWIISDSSNHEDSILNIKKFLKAHPKINLDGVMTFWEDDVLLTSKIVDQFNLVGIPYSIAKNVRNKYLFREFCSQNGIPAPRHHIIRSQKDVNHVLETYKFPLVVKPAFGSSSAYVVKVDTKEELFTTVEYIKKNISTDIESALSDGTEILVEEYIDGDEVDIDILIQNGKIKFYSIADNYNKSKDEFFVDSGQAIPSGLPEEDQSQLLAIAEETLEKLGIQNGCIHFEAKSTKNGPVPIEVNLRMGGDYVYSYTKGAWSVDLIEYTAKIALGIYIKLEKEDNPKKYIVGWDLHPDSSGILVKLDINKELHEKKYLEEIHLYKEIGDPVLLPPEGYESLGWITISGDNILDAQDNLKEALSFIEYEVVKYDEESSLGKTARKNRLSAAVLNKKILMGAAKIEKFRHARSGENKNFHIGILQGIHNNISDVYVKSQKTIEQILKERGYTVTFFDFNNPSKAFSELQKSDVDLVFNAHEGMDSYGLFRPQIAAMLEMLEIPFTGSSSLTLALCQDKIRMKKLFAYHNIPTPKWDYAYYLDDKIDDELKYPLIIKPGNTDNSFSVTSESVVKNKTQLQKQLKKIISDLGRPALIEEYIEGDEYDITILGNKQNIQVLPLSRSIFRKKLNNKKWHIRSNDTSDENIIIQNPIKNVSIKLESLLTELALDTYNILHCYDYGRVKIRVDEEDNPYVVRVNSNPILDMKSPIVKSAKLVDMNYADLLEEIIFIAINRYKQDNPKSFIQGISR